MGSLPLVKILDFGCAKLRQMDAPERPQVVTKATEILGSPPYMSPEQIQGTALDERSDIYSVGCLLHEALTGYVPHLGNDSIETLVKHLRDDVMPLKTFRPDCTFPSDLDFVLIKTLDKEPSRRYQSMRQLKSELEKVRSKLQVPSSGKWWDVVGKIKKSMSDRSRAGGNRD